ncbi:MAG: addiction module protein [Deltaproteobacteria bacterium]|nr:addiction module protein [Deltaproteobacteria bacterium]
MTVEELLAQSLSLPAPERARVAREIIASLDGDTDADAAERWLDEIRRRAGELDAGSVEGVEWEQLRKRLVDLSSKR